MEIKKYFLDQSFLADDIAVHHDFIFNLLEFRIFVYFAGFINFFLLLCDRFLEVDAILKSFEKLFSDDLMMWFRLTDVAANIGKCKGDFFHIFL